jgi:hypothetical protein
MSEFMRNDDPQLAQTQAGGSERLQNGQTSQVGDFTVLPPSPLASSQPGLIPFPRPPFVAVSFPNGGEILQAGTQVTIRWTSLTFDGSLVVSHNIRLLTDGAFNRDIVTNLSGSAQSFVWTVPSIQTTQALVVVEAVNEFGSIGSDRSNGFFTIQTQPSTDTKPPTVQVMFPNGGEIFQGGQQVLIRWSSLDNVGVVAHDVRFSSDGGANFIDIAAGLSGTTQSFLWMVPNIPTMQGVIRVVARDAAGNQGGDRSDGNFTIQTGKGKEFKDGKELKEKEVRKDFFDKNFEGASFQGAGVVSPMEQRMDRLEENVGQLVHFIRQELIPDLKRSALNAEPPLESSGPTAQHPYPQK